MCVWKVCVVSNQVIVILSVQVSVCECVFSERDVLGVCVSVLFCVCVCLYLSASISEVEVLK